MVCVMDESVVGMKTVIPEGKMVTPDQLRQGRQEPNRNVISRLKASTKDIEDEAWRQVNEDYQHGSMSPPVKATADVP